MSQPHKLTISIPTFNRISNLEHLLGQLLPQLTPEVRLIIQDNCSNVVVSEATRELIGAYPEADVVQLRNKVNIGANANILRCFENCESEWLWVVGDDDEVEPIAVQTILKSIAENSNCLILNFPIDNQRKETWTTVGLNDFVEKIDGSADVPWITSTVYNVPKVIGTLRIGYQFSFAMLPHVAMLATAYKADDRCFFAADHIASRDRAEAQTEQQTPIINMALGYPVLMDLPLELQVKRKLVNKLLVTNDSPGLPLRQLAFQLLLLAINTGDRRTALYFFDQACLRRFYFDKTVKQRLEIFAYRLILLLPPQLIATMYRRVKGRAITDQTQQDRIARL